MSGKTVNSALLLLIIGNALAIASDVFIKLMEPGAPVFQFAFLRILLTFILILPAVKFIDRGKLFEGLGVHALRAHIHLLGILCMVVALTTLPLATANAIFYAAPVIVMLTSMLFLKERLTPLSIIAVVGGFGGVLVILRPVDIGLSALSALGAAVSLALAAVMVPLLPKGQSTVHKLFLNYLLIIPGTFIMAILEGAPWRTDVLVSALGSAVFILGYNASVLLAYRHVDASQVTSAEYTGLIWAIAVGWIWFGEIPDLWFFTGSLMIVAPLVMIGLNQRRKHLMAPRILPVGARPKPAQLAENATDKV